MENKNKSWLAKAVCHQLTSSFFSPWNVRRIFLFLHFFFYFHETLKKYKKYTKKIEKFVEKCFKNVLIIYPKICPLVD